MIRTVLDFLYPPLCPGCRRQPSRVGELCRNCSFDEETNRSETLLSEDVCEICDQCGEPMVEGTRCAACLLWPLPLRYFRSCWRYNDRVAAILKPLKYYERLALRVPLANALHEGAHAISRRSVIWDLLIAVPSSPQMLRKRGYAHMNLAAKLLASRLQVATAHDLLVVTAPREPQSGKPAEQRLRNIQGTYKVRRRMPPGSRILLIDDVATTGASICHAALALLDAGAATVDGVTLARSFYFPHGRSELYRSF